MVLRHGPVRGCISHLPSAFDSGQHHAECAGGDGIVEHFAMFWIPRQYFGHRIQMLPGVERGVDLGADLRQHAPAEGRADTVAPDREDDAAAGIDQDRLQIDMGFVNGQFSANIGSQIRRVEPPIVVCSAAGSGTELRKQNQDFVLYQQTEEPHTGLDGGDFAPSGPFDREDQKMPPRCVLVMRAFGHACCAGIER